MFARTKRALVVGSLLAAVAQPMTGTASAAAVVGYVYITWNTPATSPTVVIGGVLSTWSCTQTTWPTTGPFRVDCVPPSTSTGTTLWQCDVLHANSATYTPLAKLRTTMLCDNTVVGQTNTVGGVGGNHYVWGLAGTTVSQKFSCVVDNGAAVPAMAVPNFLGFCGDPPSFGLLG